MDMLKQSLLFASLAFALAAQAAPLPSASLSRLAAPKLGVFKSPLGFELKAAADGWTAGEPPEGHRYIQAVYRGPTSRGGHSAPMLTVRADKLERPVTLDRYVQKWLREYPKYGFDVVGSKAFTQNHSRGYVLDLVNREGRKQLRQAVFLKKKTAVILTCRDQESSFKDALKGCNEIIRTFRWN